MEPSTIVLLIALSFIYFITISRNGVSKQKDIINNDSKNEYSVFITDSFSKEDAEVMRPLFTLVFTKGGDRQEAILCKVLDNNGEIDLKESEKLMLENINYAFKDNIFVDSILHSEGLIDQEEKAVAARLGEEGLKLKK